MKRDKSNLCQQLSIIEAHCGSTSVGISNRWFMKPTAPITCKYTREILVKNTHYTTRDKRENSEPMITQMFEGKAIPALS